MRLLTFGASGARPGAELRSGDIIDLAEAFRDRTNVPLRSIADLLAMGAEGLRLAARLIGSAETDPQNAERRNWIVPAGDIGLLPPMGAKVLIVATSGYFNSHLAEMKVSA